MSGTPVHTLNDGRTIPAVGLGTYPLDDDAAEKAVAGALGIGYRLVDTALNYGNETGTGRGVARSDVPREEVFVTTKVPGRHHGYEKTLASFEESRSNLGLDYVDLYLIHWPLPKVGLYVDTWRALIKLREEGLVRSIGVSNFTAEHLERLEDETGVVPAVNQIELHPGCRRRSCGRCTRRWASSRRAGARWGAAGTCWPTRRWWPSPRRTA